MSNSKKRQISDIEDEDCDNATTSMESPSKKSDQNNDESVSPTPQPPASAIIDDLFSRCKAEALNTESGDDVTEDTSYISVKEFNQIRLNVIQQQPTVDIKADMTNFNKFLDLELDGQLFEDTIKSYDNVDTRYQILYSMVLLYFTSILEKEEDILQLIVVVLNSLIIFKENLPHSQFPNKINAIIKAPVKHLDTQKMQRSLKGYLAKYINKTPEELPVADDSESKKDESYHFPTMSKLYNNLLLVFTMCSKITQIATSKTLNFKQLRQKKIESRDSAGNKIDKPGLVLDLQSPVLLKISTKQIADGISIYTCEESLCEGIVNKIRKALYLRNKESERLDLQFYPGINVGELKKMTTLKFYESSNKIVTTNKEFISDESYIMTNSLEVIYNEGVDKFGLALKCWPTKNILNDGYGNNIEFHMLDLSYDKRLFNFMEETT